MATAAPQLQKFRATDETPYHVLHPTFVGKAAEKTYGGVPTVEPYLATFMPDEVTRDYAMRMHYAAYRSARATTPAKREEWRRRYLAFRDAIIMGNRKLVFRAVRRWSAASTLEDDLIGDCQIVMIQAVSAYNPWMGIRFSTYAFTCLMRALSRLSQKLANDRFNRSLPLDSLPNGEPMDLMSDEPPMQRLARIDEFLQSSNSLLSTREKMVLQRRFRLDEQAKPGTLEQVGRELGLSKERVRQVQASALGKLRRALQVGAPAG